MFEIVPEFMPDFERFKPILLNVAYGDHEFFGKKYTGIGPVTFPIRSLIEEAVGFEVNIRVSHVRFGLRSTPLTNVIHSDHVGCEYAMVWTIQTPDCESGTAFWRHKETGTDRFPVAEAPVWPGPQDKEKIPAYIALNRKAVEAYRQEVLAKAKANRETFERFNTDSDDESKWTMMSLVPNVENQAVFFDSTMWHSRWPRELPIADDEKPRVVVATMFDRRSTDMVHACL